MTKKNRDMRRKRLEILLEIDRLDKLRCEFCATDSGFSSANKSICDCPSSVEVAKLGNQLMKLVSARKNAETKVKITPNFTDLTLENLTVKKYQEFKKQEVSDAAIFKGLGVGARRLNKWKIAKGLRVW